MTAWRGDAILEGGEPTAGKIENGRQGRDTQPWLLRQFFRRPAWSTHSSTWGLVCLSSKLMSQDKGCLPWLCLQLVCGSQTGSGRVGNQPKESPKSTFDQRGQVMFSWSPKQLGTEPEKRGDPVMAHHSAARLIRLERGWKCGGD